MSQYLKPTDPDAFKDYPEPKPVPAGKCLTLHKCIGCGVTNEVDSSD